MLVLLRGRFARLAFKVINQITWQQVFLVIGIHFLTSWFGVLLFERGAEYAQPDTYWWFYIVTITTVGYGDFSPSELGSRLVVALYVMPVGIAIAGAIIGKIAAFVVEISEKMQRGKMTLHIENHTIVIGDNSPHTIDLLKNLIADESVGKVVLVSDREHNPLNGALAGFVSGDVSDEDVQLRASFATAARVIVLGADDTTVTGRTIAVMDCVPTTTQIVAYFQHESAAVRMNNQTDDRVRTVASVSMDLVVQETLDPGAAGFVKELLRNGEGGTYMRLVVPAGVYTTWAELGYRFMLQDINPMTLYVNNDPDAIPKGSTVVKAGDILAVAAADRAQLDAIDWSPLQKAA